MTEQKSREWFVEVLFLLEEHVDVLSDSQHIFNIDETGFCLAPKEGLILGPRVQKF